MLMAPEDVIVPPPETTLIFPPVVLRKLSFVIFPPTKRSLAIPTPPDTMRAPLVVCVDGVKTSIWTN